MQKREAEVFVGADGTLSGGKVVRSEKRLKELCGVFHDGVAFCAADPETVVYRVEMHDCEKQGTAGGLLFGTSFVNAGKVGDEYFMTKGHFHARRECAEYYWCIRGEGYLLLQDEEDNCTAERLVRGSLHYIPGGYAHRLVNTGRETLCVGACWGSDAGHDYAIAARGFSVRVVERDGNVAFVSQEK